MVSRLEEQVCSDASCQVNFWDWSERKVPDERAGHIAADLSNEVTLFGKDSQLRGLLCDHNDFIL